MIVSLIILGVLELAGIAYTAWVCRCATNRPVYGPPVSELPNVPDMFDAR